MKRTQHFLHGEGNSRIFKTADPAVRFAPGTAVVLGKLSFANEKGIVAQGENGNAAFKDIQIKPALNMPACSKIRGKLNQKFGSFDRSKMIQAHVPIDMFQRGTS